MALSPPSPSRAPPPSFSFLDVSYPANAVCHCQLSRPPVNALNTDVWTELLSLLTFLEHSHFPDLTNVLIFSSAARAPIFSAGNDLTELHAPSTSKQRFHTFWTASTLFLARLYRTPLYTIAALRGATPAGGCVLSLCCDYRIAQDDITMGLNEVAIGLSVPKFYALLLLALCTVRSEAERMLSTGEMVSAQRAKRLGLVDSVVPADAHQLLAAALRAARTVSDPRRAAARAATKLEVRSQFAHDWEAYAREEAQTGWTRLRDPAVVERLERVLSKLGARRAKI